jgi:hypothetical protein
MHSASPALPRLGAGHLQGVTAAGVWARRRLRTEPRYFGCGRSNHVNSLLLPCACRDKSQHRLSHAQPNEKPRDGACDADAGTATFCNKRGEASNKDGYIESFALKSGFANAVGESAPSLNAVLIVATWHSKRQRTPHHTPRGPRPSVTRRDRLALQTIENRVRPSERIGRFMK